MKIRNNWKRAFKEGRLNDIPAEVRSKVIEQLEAGPKEEAAAEIESADAKSGSTSESVEPSEPSEPIADAVEQEQEVAEGVEG